MRSRYCAPSESHRAVSLSHKILVIEHDIRLQRLLRRTLTSVGYRVLEAADWFSGIQVAKSQQPSIIILDHSLPKFDKLAAEPGIRRSSSAPIITLCENNEEGALALDSLAEDFITKPFSKEEVVARVRKAIAHSAPMLTQNATFTLDSLRVDFLENRVFVHGHEVNLTPTEFKVLSCLIQHCGRVLSPETILDAVWGGHQKNNKNTLRTIIHGLRLKIEDDAAMPTHLTTEINVGYRLKEPQAPVPA